MKEANYKKLPQYIDYIKEANSAIRQSCPDLKKEITLEIESHIYEGMCSEKFANYSEEERLKKLLSKLGNPNKLVTSICLERGLYMAIKKHNLFKVYCFAIKNIIKMTRYAFWGGLYMLSVVFVFISGMKLFRPNNTGLFLNEENHYKFGYFSSNNNAGIEILGYWLIPIMLILAIILYLIPTLAIKKTFTH